ncbi:outer mitochondrial membrane transport complex protein-domain-containing protein [Chaetomium tenue]|uniref:Outer mitochondrial membrane transport complex protein-domain-containing protein n=1 Tax=Chaetomium tenue TaxID=1854479 RepID=A0ACB7PQ20_9PEZI|nr:outer mitochondrial membrane transport complex protein-domain-containing protein [Chaetomium globosum]
MVLQLHAWGPAFGLPSIDAECIAAIAYLAQTASPADYQLIQSSPSAVPTQHLPALHDTSTSTWTSGFSSITTYLLAHPPPSHPGAPQTQSQPPTTPTPTTTTTPTSTANATAYTAFLTLHASPLLSLTLYVSSANYATTTRPAYSAVLPLPLPWTEPPAVRAAHARRAAPLGLSALDTDAVRAREKGERERAVAEGWVTVPEGVGKGKVGGGGGGGGVGAALSPEQKMRIRLEGVAGEVLDVLGEVEWGGQEVGVRCLAFGYLALMLVPEVPRPWLREVMEGRYPELCEFVRGFRGEVFPKGRALPWVEEEQGASAVAVGMRFVRGVLGEVPLVGERWSQWWTARKRREVLASKGVKPEPSGDLLMFLGVGLGLTAMGAGVFFYRGLPPFGAAVQVWKKPVVSFSSFGAAGAMFSGALYGID